MKKKQNISQKSGPFFLFFIWELIGNCFIRILTKYYLNTQLIKLKNSMKVVSHQLNVNEYGTQFVDRDHWCSK